MIPIDNKSFYRQIGEKIECRLCTQYCKLENGQTGICNVNKNVEGKLINLVYGYPVAIHIDPIEKKPLYHFLPGSTTFSIGTIGCNVQCPFCQNWQISQKKSTWADTVYFDPEEIVRSAIVNKCQSISFTYNEPTIFYPYIRDIAYLAKKEGLFNVFVTNGLATPEVLDDMGGLIDACNVDLKSSDQAFYKKLLKAPFTVLDTLRHLKKLGIWIEITTLLIPEENDSDAILKEIATFIAKELGIETPWHISAFRPEYRMMNKQRTSNDSLLRAYEIGIKSGLKYVYIGNSIIQKPTMCPCCSETLISRSGFYVTIPKLFKGQCPECNSEIQGVFN